jgi:signal peptidase I
LIFRFIVPVDWLGKTVFSTVTARFRVDIVGAAIHLVSYFTSGGDVFMSRLNGSLSFVEVGPLIRLLLDQHKTGELVLSQDCWSARLLLDQGRLMGAAVADRTGAEALEFICVALRNADFEFEERSSGLGPNLDRVEDPLVDLERMAADARSWNGLLPAPQAVPHVVRSTTFEKDVDVVLGLAALHVLGDLDGRLTVLELASRHGLLRTLRSLNRLRELGVIAFESGASAASPSPPRTPPDSTGHPPPPPQPPATPNGRPMHPRARMPTLIQNGPPGRVPNVGVKLDHSAPSPPLAPTRVEGTSLVSGVVDATRHLAARVYRAGARGARLEVAQAVLMTSLVIFGVRSIVQNFRVDGVSMMPAFEGGQVLLVNRAAYVHVENTPLRTILPTQAQGSAEYVFGGPQRGDVAVFRAPPQPDTDYIKRIIALPGDSVLVDNGQISVDGRWLDEPYVQFRANYRFPADGTPMLVPDGYYFVLGDNRPESFDSHAGWLVPVDDLIGRAWLRYWPPRALSVIENVSPSPDSATAQQRLVQV